MTVQVVLVVFLAMVVGLAVLPLVPAIREWRRPTDVEPLSVAQFSAVDARQFARGFRVYVEGQLAAALGAEPGPMALEGVLADGTPYILAHSADGYPRLTATERAGKEVRRLVAAAGDLNLPAGLCYRREIYARGRITLGEEATVRAAMSEADIRLEPRSRSLRWLHAGGRVVGEAGCILHGRVTADAEILLNHGCGFERLNAPRIELGTLAGRAPRPEAPDPARLDVLIPKQVSGLVSTEAGRWLVEGDLIVPAGTLVQSDLVATGRLRVDPGALILGSLKAHRDLDLDEGVRVEGAAVAGGRLRMGIGATVHGPVLAESAIELLDGVVIGAADRMTTVSAPLIRVQGAAVCHGTVWAHTGGTISQPAEVSVPAASGREEAA